MKVLGGNTIAALATPPGRGGVGIIRVSGPLAADIAKAITGKTLSPRHAEYLPFKDQHRKVIDQGIALYFPAPNSFTGEDVLELHGHGGTVVMDLLLHEAIKLGATAAGPGEFSQRAYLNGKMDLAQAEAIADLINASTEAAARSALQSMRGALSDQVHQQVESLINLRMYVESAIDFPDEEIDFLTEGGVLSRTEALLESTEALLRQAKQGCLLNEGMTLVILGQPNAGKSSLLNTLAGKDTAIVTDIPGTTRDILREQIHLDGMPINLVDTAGLREGADVVEQEGIRRAWNEVASADRVLLVIDDTVGLTENDQAILDQLPDPSAVTLVRNKVDLSGGKLSIDTTPQGVSIGISAQRGDGLDELRRHLKSVMGYSGAGEGVFMARRRHVEAMQRSVDAITRGRDQLAASGAGELLAEELRLAQEAMNEITGEFDNEALLGRIFSSFCIGK